MKLPLFRGQPFLLSPKAGLPIILSSVLLTDLPLQLFNEGSQLPLLYRFSLQSGIELVLEICKRRKLLKTLYPRLVNVSIQTLSFKALTKGQSLASVPVQGFDNRFFVMVRSYKLSLCPTPRFLGLFEFPLPTEFR